MDETPHSEKLITAITKLLTPRSRTKLQVQLTELRELAALGYRRRDTVKKFKLTVAANRKLALEWRSTGRCVEVQTYVEAAELIHCSPETLRQYISRGKGKATFAVTHPYNDVLTVTRYRYGQVR